MVSTVTSGRFEKSVCVVVVMLMFGWTFISDVLYRWEIRSVQLSRRKAREISRTNLLGCVVVNDRLLGVLSSPDSSTGPRLWRECQNDGVLEFVLCVERPDRFLRRREERRMSFAIIILWMTTCCLLLLLLLFLTRAALDRNSNERSLFDVMERTNQEPWWRLPKSSVSKKDLANCCRDDPNFNCVRFI